MPLRFKGDNFYNFAYDDKFEALCTTLGGYVTQDTSERYNIPYVNLIGKNDEVKKVLDLLSPGKNIWIHGMGALGRKALACAVANDQRARSLWPDARVFIDLRNARVCPELAMRAAIKRFELQCNAEPAQLPRIFKKIIESARCLSVIVNVVDREQIIVILQHLGPHCNALITSRQIPQSASQLILTHDSWPLSQENTIAVLKASMGERKVSSRYIAEIVRDLGK